MSPQNTAKTRRTIVVAAAAVVLLAAAAMVTVSMTRSTVSAMGEGESATPTGRVVKGTLQLDVHMKGDLRASRQEEDLQDEGDGQGDRAEHGGDHEELRGHQPSFRFEMTPSSRDSRDGHQLKRPRS